MINEKPKILIVDDNPKNLHSLRRVLEEVDIEIIEALSGQEALAKALHHEFFVILMDVQMPDMDGFETASLLYENIETSRTPIIFITAINKSERFVLKGYKTGAVDYLCKPVESEILIDKLKIFQELYEYRKTVEQHNNNLEQLVKNRTKEIERTNNALKESERTLSTLMSNLPGMVYRRKNDKGWTMEYVSDGALELIGYNPLDIKQGKTISYNETIHIDDRELIWNEVQNALNKNISFQCTYRIINSENREKWVWDQGRGILSDDNKLMAIEGYVADISQQKKVTEALKVANRQLLHSEKLSAIGKLSASIAHEFNNPLCGIRNVLENISDDDAYRNLEEPDKELVNMAIKECDRVADLIKKLQDFNRPSTEVSIMKNIEQVIDDVILMIGKRLKERKIVLKKHYSSVVKIKIVPDQIKQVILNLIQNAEESMPQGGQINITTEQTETDILTHIKDSGCGISPENMSTIFEPFFTTKSAVKGTGLGLSVTYGIIKNHGGDINVYSKQGKGTTFTIVLPKNGTL